MPVCLVDDWKIFKSEGLTIIGPPSVLASKNKIKEDIEKAPGKI